MRKSHIRTAWLAAATAFIIGSMAPVFAARAQTDGVQDLINRIDRLQRELSTLQRAYYRGKPPPAAASSSGAAAAPTGSLDSTLAARIEIRLTQLETEIQKLTGRAEELQHAVGQFDSRFTKLVSDVDLRLRALEQGTSPTAAEAPPLPLAAMTPPPPAAAARAARINPAPDAPPQILGTVPERRTGRPAAAPPPAQSSQSASRSAPIDGTPEQQYDHATSLLLNDQDFSGAEQALKAFIKRYPDHELAGNAHYWLGETFYVRKDYRQAAFTFADGYQRFPKSNKAPDNLLKLGMALGQLGQEKEACTAFARLLTNFPDIGDTLKSRVQRQRQRHQCR